MNAHIELNSRTVQVMPDGFVEVQVPNGWDDVKTLVGKVLRVNSTLYGFTGWNSDRNVAYFKAGVATARFV